MQDEECKAVRDKTGTCAVISRYLIGLGIHDGGNTRKGIMIDRRNPVRSHQE